MVQITDIRCVLPHNINTYSWRRIAREAGIPIGLIYLDQVPRMAHCFGADTFINLAIAERDAMKAELDRQVFERWRAHEVLEHALAQRNRLIGENVALRTALDSTQRMVRTRAIKIRRERSDDDA